MCRTWNHSTQRERRSSCVRSKLSFVLSVTNLLPTAVVAQGKTKYQQQHSGIPNTQIMWLLLSIFLMTYERDSCTFIPFPDILAIHYTTLKYCNLPRSGLRKNRISTHRQWHSRHTNYVATLEYFLIGR
jgi:hypothetical protein